MTKAGSPRLGWALCLAAPGDGAACPGVYGDKHVIYDGFADGRACSACSCEAPSGSQCVADLEVYLGGTCQGPTAIGGMAISVQDAPFCVDLPAGTALGAKVMSAPVYLPGSCEPRGGSSTGDVALTGAVTLCCRVG